ncbi:MAG: hypothetical protein FJW69_08180 [Actinobacteria bacterium]|nr:hypothetical protein [Actinomycetota bacterium]
MEDISENSYSGQMNKVFTIGLWIICLALLVLAAAPGTPKFYAPANMSVYMDTTFSAECGDSSDGGAPPVSYEIWANITNTTWGTVYSVSPDAFTATVTDTNSKGFRFLVLDINGTYLYSATKNAAVAGPNRVRLFTDDYQLLAEDTSWGGDTAYFATNPYLTYNTYYRIELDNDAAAYVDRYKAAPAYPFTGTEIRLTGGSLNGTSTAASYNFNSITTRESVYIDELYLMSNSTNGNVTIFNRPTIVNGNNWTCRAKNADGISLKTEKRIIYGLNFTNCTGDCISTALKFQFLDELNGSSKTGQIALSAGFNSTDKYEFFMQDTTKKSSFSFKLVPDNFNITTSGNVSFSGTDIYTQPRSYFVDEDIIGNTTTVKYLYLLSVDEGILEAEKVEDIAGSPLDGVKIVVAKPAAPPGYDVNTYTDIVGDYTGEDGSVTFWLYPGTGLKHRYTLTKPGYVSLTKYVQPSASGHTFVMSLSSENASYSAPTQGMLWYYSPAIGPVASGNAYNFQFNITSTLGTLRWCQMNITNMTGGVVATASGCNGAATYYGENLTAAYTIQEGDELYGNYYITVNSECDSDTSKCDGGVLDGNACSSDADCLMYGAIDVDAFWTELSIDTNNTATLKWALISLTDWSDFGECTVYGHCPEQEASRIIFFFLFGAIIIGAIIFFTGIEMSNPGQALLIAFVFVLAASLAGFFEIHSYKFAEIWAPWISKYSVALIFGLVISGWFFDYWRRSHTA